ncbi:hypothetical protein NSS64_10250 [Paenibacillus sp. FSL H8-0122]|uniref:hypothetical protein n=1 Tax=Paenibacillus sp. FSL H8-0122 TaxID=2954510 RepID=UPI0030FA0BE4
MKVVLKLNLDAIAWYRAGATLLSQTWKQIADFNQSQRALCPVSADHSGLYPGKAGRILQ